MNVRDEEAELESAKKVYACISAPVLLHKTTKQPSAFKEPLLPVVLF